MHGDARYRMEGGVVCVDLRVTDVRQLFDWRDPAPFRQRDLDADAVNYLVGAATELPRAAPFKIVVWLGGAPDPALSEATIRDAALAHFSSDRQQITRRLSAQFRRARMFLLIGTATLVACLSLAQLSSALLPAGGATEIAREGLLISGWVALWRPLEALLYDWWPLVDERRLVDRLLAAPLDVRPLSGDSDA